QTPPRPTPPATQAPPSTTAQPSAPRTTPAPTGLAGFVQEQGIKLAMTSLGPTGVAVFQTKEGYVVVPVGEKIPGTEVLVKTVTASEATLVRNNESLPIKLEGGE
ncbi:MAG: competence protein, partial [Meiothermus sp.]